jgi:hypothetical protein
MDVSTPYKFPLRFRIFFCLPAWTAVGLSFLCSISFGQQSNSDTVANDFLHKGYIQYMSSIGGTANIFSGSEYEGSYPQTEGIPFWQNPDLVEGTIAYDGVLYHLPMAYDLVRNEIVIKGYQQLNTKIEESRISFFRLSGHTFIRLQDDSTHINQLPEDFYDVVFDGSVKCYVKRIKRVERAFHAENPYQIKSHDIYFLLKNKTWHQVSSKKELMNLFPDESRSLKTVWKEKKLNFKKDPERAIVETLSFYTQTKNGQ